MTRPFLPATEHALRLLQSRFLNRADELAVFLSFGEERIPAPARPDDLEALLRAHLVGPGSVDHEEPAAPRAKIRYRTRRSPEGFAADHFRVGSYCPAPDGTTRWSCTDFDGGADHADGLRDSTAAALAALARYQAAGIPAHLERSKGCQGWHIWVFFGAPIPAATARSLALGMAPADAQLVSGGMADPQASRGIEVFPKQTGPLTRKSGKTGNGNMVWLPWFWGAKPGGNLFYRLNAAGQLEPYAPEDLEAAAPSLVDQVVETLPRAPSRPTSATPAPGFPTSTPAVPTAEDLFAAATAATPVTDADRAEWKARALAALNLRDIYGDLLTGGTHSGGWLECRDPESPTGDQHPSASVADGTGEAEKGTWKSFRSGEALDVFDFLQRHGGAAGKVGDFGEARRLVAQLSGVELPEQVRARAMAASRATSASTSSASATPAAAPLPALPPGVYPLTDSGNAERLVARHGADIRWCPARGGWLRWNGVRWAHDDLGEVLALAKDTARAILEEARGTPSDVYESVMAHARRSESAERRAAMLRLAQAERGISVRVDHLDARPWELNVQNGTLDLRTGKLSPHDRAALHTKLAPVVFDPEARAPLFERFLAEVQPDPEVRAYLQRWMGYCLTAAIRDHVLPIHYGTGRNGKSVFLNLFQRLLGDYATQIPTELLLARAHEAHPTERTVLLGTRFASAVETEETGQLNVSLIKQLTGADPISARFMRGDFFTFLPTHKISLATNHRPRIRDTTTSIWQRVHLVPWPVTIPPDQQDLALPDKLWREAPGVLAWAVRGCLAWQQDGLAPPDAIRAATSAYRNEEDNVGQFLADCCIEAGSSRASRKDLYEAYCAWCKSAGETAFGSQRFSGRLRDRGFETIVIHGSRYWQGVGLLVPAESAQTDFGGSGTSDSDPQKSVGCRWVQRSPLSAPSKLLSANLAENDLFHSTGTDMGEPCTQVHPSAPSPDRQAPSRLPYKDDDDSGPTGEELL